MVYAAKFDSTNAPSNAMCFGFRKKKSRQYLCLALSMLYQYADTMQQIMMEKNEAAVLCDHDANAENAKRDRRRNGRRETGFCEGLVARR